MSTRPTSDPGFANLYVWTDTNGNGVVDAGELHSLASLGITSISLASTPANELENGNVIGAVGSFTMSNGSTGQVAEAFFNNSQVDSQFNGTFTLNPEVLSLPDLRGYGNLPALFISMSQDPTLLQMVQAFAGESISDAATFDMEVTRIMYQWAGVENAAPTSRGSFINAQQLEFLEKFLDEPFVSGGTGGSNPIEVEQGTSETAAWNTAFQQIKAYLLVQGPLASLFPNVGYNFDTDSLVGTADLSSAVAAIAQGAPSDPASAQLYWASMVPFIQTVAGDLRIPASQYQSQLAAAFAQANLPFTLAEAEAGAVHLGLNGEVNDVMVGTSGPQYFDSQGAFDTLIAQSDSNTFVFGHGYGNVTVDNVGDNANNDTILFNPDVAPSQVTLTRAGNSNNLTVTLDDGSTLTIQGQFADDSGFFPNRLDVFQFQDANQTVWTANQVEQLVIQQAEAAGDTTLYGFNGGSHVFNDSAGGITFLGEAAGDTTISGLNGTVTYNDSQGNVTFNTQGGNNTIDFGLGYGTDTYTNSRGPFAPSNNILLLNPGIDPSHLTLQAGSGNSLDVILSDGSTFVVPNQFTTQQIDEIEFQNAAHTVLSVGSLDQLLINQQEAAGDTTISGLNGTVTYNDNQGNVTFNTQGGNNTVDFGLGYGTDTFTNSRGPFAPSNNVLRLNAGISPSQVTLELGPSNSLDVVLSDGSTLVVPNQFGAEQLDEIEFQNSSSTVWTAAQFSQILINDEEAAGDSTVTGFGGTNIYNDSQGNVTFNTQGGTNTIHFGLDYGTDTFTNSRGPFAPETNEVLINAGISPSQVTLEAGPANSLDIVLFDGSTLVVPTQFASQQIDEIQFQDSANTTWTASQLKQLSINQAEAAGDTTITGFGGADTFNDSSGGVTFLGNGGADTVVFGAGYGQDVIEEPSQTATVLLNSGVTESELVVGDAGPNLHSLALYVAGTNDSLTMLNDDVTQVQFADGTVWSAQTLSQNAAGNAYFDNGNVVVDLGAGTATISGSTIGTLSGITSVQASSTGDTLLADNGANDTLTATNSNDTLVAGSGTDRLIGTGTRDVYQFGTGDGQTTIANGAPGGTSASNQLNFTGSLSIENLWLQQSGDNLQIDVLGTQSQVTVQNWFGSAGNQLQEITAGGLEIDSQMAELVQAMATYSANNPSFNPATATQMPNDPTLQSAISSAWHH
jgi:hypothetical protein